MFFLLLHHTISSIWGKVGHSYWRRLLSKEHVFKSCNLRSGTWSCLLSEVRQDVVVEDVVSDMPLLMLYSGLSHYLDGASLVQSSQTKRIVLVPLGRGRYCLDKHGWVIHREVELGTKVGEIGINNGFNIMTLRCPRSIINYPTVCLFVCDRTPPKRRLQS